jgi:redox-sensitive bicupin YhaK (pirin superfamily)
MTVGLVVTAKARDVGGFDVRRALPTAQLRAVGPFVFLDQMGPARIAAGKGLDVRPHPHIGLSTMTYLYQGEIMHRDSLGTVQAIQPGAVNWMTAGRGIVHSERSPQSARTGEHALFGLQFWVALPRTHEEVEPSFLHLGSDALPAFSDAGVEGRVIAGEMAGRQSPLAAPHPMICVDLALQAGARVALPSLWPEQAVYVSAGAVELGNQRLAEGQLAVLSPGAETLAIAVAASRMMLLGGAPLDGPRHIWWNFVSSSAERIEQAKEDWRHGRFAPVPGESEFIPLPE